MVIFFTSNVVDPPVTLYMGRDKVENEDLIKYAWPQDVWFHVDKLSSAHVYLRMTAGMTWETIPQEVLTDCAQLVKANSIEGNKKDNLTVVYTPADNLKKTGDMAVGQVSFHRTDKAKMAPVKRIHVPQRQNPIVNRLNKTKVEKDVDHEQERVERLRVEANQRRAAAAEKKRADAELAKQREAEKQAKTYDSVFNSASSSKQTANDDIWDDEGGELDETRAKEFEDFF